MNKDKKVFDDILNECIERMLKGVSVEKCLASFPEYAAELEPLLRTVAATRKATDILPRPDFRQKAAAEFQTAVRNIRPGRKSSFEWQVRLVTAIAIVMVVLLAGTGTVAAASNSLPDEPLYGVKILTENIRIALTPSEIGKAELYAQFADTRVNEIIKMAEAGKVTEVVKTTERMDGNLTAIAKLTQSEGDSGAGGEETAAEAASVAAAPADTATMSAPGIAAVPAPVTATAPSPDTAVAATPKPVTVPPPVATAQAPTTVVTPTPNVSVAASPQITQKPTVLSGPTNAPTGQAPSAVQKVTPTPAQSAVKSATANATRTTVTQNTVKNDKAELQTSVSQQAAKNAEKLKQALQRVPDNVKPSIQRAIDIAGKGYDEALKNINHRR